MSPRHARPHQAEAIAAATAALADGGRAQVIMACGTGKTLVGQRVAEAVAPSGAVLILVPTIGLLDQTARAWTAATLDPPSIIAVCSDEKVGTPDESGMKAADLHLPVTTDAEELVRLVAKAGVGQVVVICTYASSGVIEEAHECGLGPWALMVADEAHRMAGGGTGLFGTALHDAKIPVARRLFLTATPRIHEAPETGTAVDQLIFSMDDPDLFGEVCYELSFPEAIDRGLLSDYRVAVVGVTSDRVAEFLADNPSLGEMDALAVATQIVTTQAAREFDLRAMLAFHNLVSRSRAWARTFPETLAGLSAAERPQGAAAVAHIDSTTPVARRREALDLLDEAHASGGWALVSNVQCLTEGIDVPSLDGLVICDPRSSTVDVAQAVGRAIRLNPYRDAPSVILLPVFLRPSQDATAVLEASGFRHVYQTLRALQDHDERLVAAFTDAAWPQGMHTDALDERLIFRLPDGLPEGLEAALRVQIVDRQASPWEVGLAELKAYYAAFGTSEPRRSYVAPSGRRLGAWVRAQRALRRQGRLGTSRVAALDALGFEWEPRYSGWQLGFEHLRTYQDAQGHLAIPQQYETSDGYPLGVWVGTQRYQHKTGTLSADRVADLESIGFQWDVREALWHEGLAAVAAYIAEHGPSIPVTVVNDTGLRVGQWASVRRRERRSGRLSAERIAALDAIGFAWEQAVGRRAQKAAKA